MEGLKVSVLFYEDRSKGGTERDEVVDEVAAALAATGHTPALLGIYDDLRELVDKLDEQQPDLVFNLCETFAGRDSNEGNVTAALVLLGKRFTGTGPVGMALRADKAVTKKLLQFHEVRCPKFAIFDTSNLEFAGRMHFPLFIKPMRGDASVGIHDASLVRDYDSLVERINLIQRELKDAALGEEYIEGREFYVGVLGNDPPEALPVIEMDFSKLPQGYPHIYGWEAKFDHTSKQYDSVNAIIATDLVPEVRHRITMAALEACYALQVRDYARVDIRLSPDGTPYVVEVNANPYLERTSAFAIAALQAGMGYNTLINRIVQTAWRCSEESGPAKGLACSLPLRPELRDQVAEAGEPKTELP
jgi:D-alanine-D-alanine ligase